MQSAPFSGFFHLPRFGAFTRAVVAMKDEFKFRLLADESASIGVLGKTGRGLTEHFGVDVCFPQPRARLDAFRVLIV